MAVKTMEDLFIHELSDIYSAEKQMSKALPRLAKNSESEQLSAAFEAHLEETLGQIERIDQVVEVLGIKLKRMKCVAMEGLVEESKEVIDEVEAGPVRDAALIGGAQKAEHYEIAAYGTLCRVARQLATTTRCRCGSHAPGREGDRRQADHAAKGQHEQEAAKALS